ncbi:hypothetical protein PR048_012931 [Dryococelus australis]|uniref:Uncharacterized protein n=1 Tax=Dryococelus australis TaxID=614101 RepID=A0ABQ9HRJ4_9NEOP|nr:hypothetical protein PR048_012931 [Dryococelus australis]
MTCTTNTILWEHLVSRDSSVKCFELSKDDKWFIELYRILIISATTRSRVSNALTFEVIGIDFTEPLILRDRQKMWIS